MIAVRIEGLTNALQGGQKKLCRDESFFFNLWAKCHSNAAFCPLSRPHPSLLVDGKQKRLNRCASDSRSKHSPIMNDDLQPCLGKKTARAHHHSVLTSSGLRIGTREGCKGSEISSPCYIGCGVKKEQAADHLEQITPRSLSQPSASAAAPTRALLSLAENLPLLSRREVTPVVKLFALTRYSHQRITATTNMIPEIFIRFLSTAKSSILGPKPLTGPPVGRDEEIRLLTKSKGNKKVEIVACRKLHEQPSMPGPASGNGGIKFTVHYYDSLESIISSRQANGQAVPELKMVPVVCLLHGAPGSYEDFSSLINYLTSRSIRVIAPNFPDYSATLEHNFRHSPPERADFLSEFFNAISVNKIDLIVGHSSSVYTMLELVEKSLSASRGAAIVDCPRICSIAMFSTPSYNLPRNLVPTPLRLLTLKLFDYPIMRPFITGFVDTFVRIQGIQNRVDRIEDILVAASTMGNSRYEQMKHRLELIREHKLPRLLIYGTKDRLIPVDYFRKLAKDLGASLEDGIKCYNGDSSVKKEPSQDCNERLAHVSEFESGGHYVFQRHSRQVNEDVYRFLVEQVLKREIESTKL